MTDNHTHTDAASDTNHDAPFDNNDKTAATAIAAVDAVANADTAAADDGGDGDGSSKQADEYDDDDDDDDDECSGRPSPHPATTRSDSMLGPPLIS